MTSRIGYYVNQLNLYHGSAGDGRFTVQSSSSFQPRAIRVSLRAWPWGDA
ncbi:hypothetical protein Hanom_Chr10g00966861 [Helianthus anomalus]